MTIAVLALLIGQALPAGQATPLPTAPPLVLPVAPVAGLPPVDWAPLPVLRYRRRPNVPAVLSDFVRDEVHAGRCAMPAGSRLSVDFAVLIAANGAVRRIVPRAIGCPTVEQYASGLMLRLARDNVLNPVLVPTWYRAGLTFAWGR